MLDIKIVMTPFSIFAEVSIIFTPKNMGQNPTEEVILGGIQKLRRQKGVGGQSNVYACKINENDPFSFIFLVYKG